MVLEGGAPCEKIAFEGGHPKKIREKGGHVKYFSKTLKSHNVLILKRMPENKHSRQDANLFQTFLLL